MTTLRQLRDRTEDLIRRYGSNHQVACFLIGEDEIQDIHLGDEAAAISEAASEGDEPDPWLEEPTPLTPEQLGRVIHHLENDGAAYAKLFGAPLHEAIDQAFAPTDAGNDQ